MRYRYHYTEYQHSKLATFISGLQGSFLGAIAFAMMPALPFLVLFINTDNTIFIIIYALILIVGTISIMAINTDKLAEKIAKKKQNKKHLKR